jgi:hypothetical protein
VTIVIIGSFYAAVSVSYLLENQKSRTGKWLFCIFIVALSIPRLFYMEFVNIRQIFSPVIVIHQQEISAMNFIRERTSKDSLILVDPRIGLSDYDSPYVSYIADRSTYYSGIKFELESHGINYAGRKK